MGWLIADTDRVAVDAAAPGQDLYEYFVEEVVELVQHAMAVCASAYDMCQRSGSPPPRSSVVERHDVALRPVRRDPARRGRQDAKIRRDRRAPRHGLTPHRV